MRPRIGIVWKMPSPKYATSMATMLSPRLDCSIGPSRPGQKIRGNCSANRCIVLVGVVLLTKPGWTYGP